MSRLRTQARLHHCVAPIHHNGLPCHERAVFTGQEAGNARQVLRQLIALNGKLVQVGIAKTGNAIGLAGDALRQREPWCNGVDVDAIFAELSCNAWYSVSVGVSARAASNLSVTTLNPCGGII